MDETRGESLTRRIQERLATVRATIQRLQAEVVRGSELLGLVDDAFEFTERNWGVYFSAGPPASDHLAFLSAAGDTLAAFSTELDNLSGSVQRVVSDITDMASTSSAFASGTLLFLNATGLLTAPTSTVFIYSPLERFKNHSLYESKLAALDPELGRTYGELIEVVHATRAAPARPAMFLARQLFDHLLDVLAPDDDVRRSEFWREKTSKESKNPSAVWRNEKVLYAARRRVRDPGRAQTLLGSSAQILEVYQLLNKAHKRGELDADQSTEAVNAMLSIVQVWADSAV